MLDRYCDYALSLYYFIQPPTICSFQEAFYQLKVFRDGSNEQVIETERQRIDNSQSVVEAEITSMILQANKDYQATLLYETNFSTLEAEMQFSKC